MEDVAVDVAKAKAGTTIAKLLANLTPALQDKYAVELDDALAGLRQNLDATGNARANDMQTFDAAVNEKLAALFPGVEIALHVPTPEIKEIFKQATIKVRDAVPSGEWRDVTAMGHGAQRSIQMALIRQLAETGTNAVESGARTLLLIDEPELYLHPQGVAAVRCALRQLSKGSYQVIFATHSPLMITKEELPTTHIVRKSEADGTYCNKTVEAAIQKVSDKAEHQTETLFDLKNASQILFADCVLLVEGSTEGAVLPCTFEELTGETLADRRVALVELGGSGSSIKCMQVLDAMAIPAKAVVDLDFVFRHASDAGLVDHDCEEIAACKELLTELAPTVGFDLDDEGLPQKKDSVTAADAFKALAADQRSHPHIRTLHDRLKAKSFWLWELGRIEEHLGLQGGSRAAWRKYATELEVKGFEDVVADPASVLAFVTWVQTSSATTESEIIQGG